MRVVGGITAIAVSICLQGCAEWGAQWADRYGPGPVPDPTIVADASRRNLSVVAALTLATGFGPESRRPSSRRDWYDIIFTGFNTVDDACYTYLNDLWKFDRRKGRVKDFLSATQSAVVAIVGAAPSPSSYTLTTLAQAFGLGTALTTALADSYLFERNPATIQKLVKKSTDAYRADVVKNINTATYPMDSPAAAYFHVRSYLALCMPQTIEAQVDDYLAAAKAVPEKPAPATPGAKPAPKTSTNIEFKGN